ncbi:hypothetical protein Tco_0005280 [Tanacetum coccineum]
MLNKKRIEESVKADLAKQEGELGKEELVDLLGIDVVKGFYKAKLQYEKYCDKMLNRRVQSRIIICDVPTRKGLITLKVCPNRKGVGWSTINGSTKFNSSVQYEDHPVGTMLNEPCLDFIKGEIVGSVPELFSLSVDLNIKFLNCKLAEDKFSFVLLKTVQLQLFKYIEDQAVSSLQFM